MRGGIADSGTSHQAELVRASRGIRSSCHRLLDRMLPYLESHIEKDDSRYHGALLENLRTVPALPTWPHAVYPSADGYASLAAGSGDRHIVGISRDMIDYMVREQSESGCWCGYCGYPKSHGWNEENAPPNSFFNVVCPGGVVQDIIWSPFSVFGTAIYGRVVARALKLGLAADLEQAKRWRRSAQLAFEFARKCVDIRYSFPESQGWDQDAHVAALMAVAAGCTGQERFEQIAVKMMERVLGQQFASGEYPVIGDSVLSIHYHFFTLDALQDWRQALPGNGLSPAVAESVGRALDWAWKTQQEGDGDFSWTRYPPEDHKSRMFATFGLGFLATAPESLPYEAEIERALAFLTDRQNPDGGFPVHIVGEPDSDTCWASGTLLQGLGRLLWALPKDA